MGYHVPPPAPKQRRPLPLNLARARSLWRPNFQAKRNPR
ncbi:hypothetical protein Murka_0032 [Xanthomonas phage Murka]|nr:hypothetical protein Murka_0032 [Xanthomonas phage Murka]